MSPGDSAAGDLKECESANETEVSVAGENW